MYGTEYTVQGVGSQVDARFLLLLLGGILTIRSSTFTLGTRS